MKRVAILVPKGAAALSCIEGANTLFTQANRFLEQAGSPPCFHVRLVGLSREPEHYDRMFAVTPDIGINEPQHNDLIIIPAVNGNMEKVIEMNEGFFPWIKAQHAAGAEVASLCVGTFLLASTGLLDGKKCATHWGAAHHFREMFPLAQLVSEKIITDEQGVYSSGGANSFWNLLIYIVEKYTNRELAIRCAKFYEIEIDRNTQSPFIIFQGQHTHHDESVKRAQAFIETNFREKITVDQLCNMCAVGKRSLERRFKKATCNTVSEYIQRVKIEAAKKDMESSRKNVSEIMYELGYSDTKAFRNLFKKTTGLSPVEYRNKYSKHALMFSQS